MNDVVARVADESDWTDIEDLLTQNALPHAGAREHLRSYWVAEDDTGVVGTIGVETYGAAGLLRSVAVRPARQTSGIGRLLVEVASAAAVDGGIQALYLLTTTAAGYFQRQGFVVVERDEVPAAVRMSIEFHGACPESAICMRRRIA